MSGFNIKNEKLLNKSGIALFALSAVYMLVRFAYGQMQFIGFMIGLLAFLLVCARYVVLRTNALREGNRLTLRKIIDIALALTLLFSFLPHSLLAPIYLFAIAGACISYGSRTGKLVLYVAMLSYMGGFIEDVFSRIRFSYSVPLDYIIYILSPLAFVYVISMFFLKNITIGDDYANELKKSNEQLNMKVAEFYTLQYIQNSIATIRDTKMLFEAVNDMIIGVIGPTYSSIILRKNFENEEVTTGDFELWASNIEESNREEFLKRDCPVLWDRLGVGNGFLYNTLDCDLKLSDSRIKCFIAVPLAVKDNKVGLIIVAHYVEDALNEEFLRFLEVISGNISMALENTWLYEKMHDMATIDALTRVYNRGYFNQVVEEEFIKSINRHPMAIAICDLDYFKSINDNYGHLFGDKVLSEVAKIMQSSLRSGDILARYGGEEFAIIFPKADAEQAYLIAERLRQKVEDTVIEDKYYSVYTTISFGIAAYPEHGASVRRILKKADEALYQGKREGRNCTRIAVDSQKELQNESLRVGRDQRDRQEL